MRTDVIHGPGQKELASNIHLFQELLAERSGGSGQPIQQALLLLKAEGLCMMPAVARCL